MRALHIIAGLLAVLVTMAAVPTRAADDRLWECSGEVVCDAQHSCVFREDLILASSASGAVRVCIHDCENNIGGGGKNCRNKSVVCKDPEAKPNAITAD